MIKFNINSWQTRCIIALIGLNFLLQSCKKNNSNTETPSTAIEMQIRDLNIQQEVSGVPPENSKPIYFNLSKGEMVQETETWDIAFTGMANTTITANTTSGVWLHTANTDYDLVLSKPSIDYDQVSSGNGNTSANGWYSYDQTAHTVAPIKGKTIFIKTKSGIVYKFVMMSIYKGAPTYPTLEDKAPYLTFKYKELK